MGRPTPMLSSPIFFLQFKLLVYFMNFYRLLLLPLLMLVVGCTDSKKSDDPTPPSSEPTIALELSVVGEEEVEVSVTTAHAVRAAVYCLPAEERAPDAETIFGLGKQITPSEEPQQLRFENLMPEREYCLYGLAVDNAGELSQPATLTFKTQPSTKMLRRGEATKRSFSYHVVLPEEQADAHYLHAYFPAEQFEYQLRSQQAVDGEEFNYDSFLKNILISYGFIDQGSKEITWSAGDKNEWYAPYIATIVGGKRYYAMMALTNSEGTEFLSEACAVDMTTEPAGSSTEQITVKWEDVSTSNIRVRMECPENVVFFFYNMVTKSSWDEKREKDGPEGMMNYLYEYGWPVANTYTDAWSVNHGTEYMLGILGVDINGDLFLQEHPVCSKDVTPEIAVTLKPYERDLLGVHAYDTFYVEVVPYYFDSLEVEMWAIFDEMGRVNEAMAAAGTTLEEFAQNPTREVIEKLGDFIEPLPQEEHELLATNGYLSGLYNNFEPETEYCYLLVIPHRDKLYCGYQRATTEALYGGGEPTAAYSAFLGEWVVTGQSTEDYYTRKSYTLRIEPLTVNRSYKIYGWSMSDISEEFPFEARFIPETGRISIQGAQMLGVKEIQGEEHIIVLNGYFFYAGELGMLGGYDGTFYEGRCSGTHLSMFAQIFEYGGATYDFQAMGYTSLINGNYFTLEGEEYNLVKFTIDRPSSSYSAPTVLHTPLHRGPAARVHDLKAVGNPEAPRRQLPMAPIRSYKR